MVHQVMKAIWLLVVLFSVATSQKEKPTRNVVVTAEEEKVRDAAGYHAISEIHKEMDDDHSGSIDRSETTGFMTEDMQMRSSDRARRESSFHRDDDAITIDDLWEAWFESEERAWSNEQVLHWIVNVVNLPMYADNIIKAKVDGSVLPRLAVHNSTYMAQKLGIKSSVHRQKLRLNALDVVLFGYRDPSSKTKDVALALLCLLLTSVLILYARQRRRARLQVHELSTRLTQLKTMETEFEDVQKKWNDERSKRSTADGGVSEIEVENLRIQLEEAERRLEEGGSSGGTPLALQPLLRRTCESEMSFLEKQRQECFKEMKEAIDMVDRLQKKQSSVLSSLKLATGAASASDQVDSKIFALKSRMEKIHNLTRDTQERWLQIESLCGFPILYMNEAAAYHNSSSGHFYGSPSDCSSVSGRSLQHTPSTGALGSSSFEHDLVEGSKRISLPKQSSAPVQQYVQPQFQTVLANGELHEDGERITPPIRFIPKSNGLATAQTLSEDTESIASSAGPETKKKRGLINKLFKKSSSKGSIASSTMPETTSISNPNAVSKPKMAAKKLFVVKVRCIPFGFFEKELLGYFSQFGTVARVRVARSLKTGNFKGWAYVGFDNKDVADIACETMNGYLMFEKRLICTVMTENPKCMLSGPQMRAPPHMKGAAKKDTKQRHVAKPVEKVDKAKERMVKQLAKQEQALKNMGIDYDFSAVPSYTKASSAAFAMDVKKKEEKPIDEAMEIETVTVEVTPKKQAKKGGNVIANIIQEEASAKKSPKVATPVSAIKTPTMATPVSAKKTLTMATPVSVKKTPTMATPVSVKKSPKMATPISGKKSPKCKTPRRGAGKTPMRTPSVPTRIQPKRNKSVQPI